MGKIEELASMTIEQGFERLAQIKTAMENPAVSLEDSFALYAEGVELIKVCNSKLDATEQQVKILSADGSLLDFDETAREE